MIFAQNCMILMQFVRNELNTIDSKHKVKLALVFYVFKFDFDNELM